LLCLTKEMPPIPMVHRPFSIKKTHKNMDGTQVKRICRRCAAVDVQRFQQISTSLETILVRANFTQDSAHARLSSRTIVKYKRLVISCDDMELTHASFVSPLCICIHMIHLYPFCVCEILQINVFFPNDFDTCVHNKCFC
jgi:hypothetical protein